jgi:hypothetical protein
MRHWIFTEPALALGAPIYLSAAMLFPFYLGWGGVSYWGLSAYLLLAAAIFCLVDAREHPSLYPKWRDVCLQSLLSLLVLSLPGGVAFALGHAVAPVDEQYDDQACVQAGYSGTSDAPADEANDALDLMPDCVP